MTVRCNECMHYFQEEGIPVDEDGIEHCPNCGTAHALMDTEQTPTGHTKCPVCEWLIPAGVPFCYSCEGKCYLCGKPTSKGVTTCNSCRDEKMYHSPKEGENDDEEQD